MLLEVAMGRWAQAKRRGAVRHVYALTHHNSAPFMSGVAGVNFVTVSWDASPDPQFWRVKFYIGAFPGLLSSSRDVPGSDDTANTGVIAIATQTWYAEVQAFVGGLPQELVRAPNKTY